MSIYIDYKIIIWQRMEFDDNANIKELIQTIKDLDVNACAIEALGFQNNMTLYDTEELINPHENGDYATIEIYQDDICVWNNGKEFQV